MKGFKFRLQRVLDYRSRICDERRQELVLRNYERDQEIQRLENLRLELSELGGGENGIYHAYPTGGAALESIEKFLMFDQYARRLEQEIERQVTRVEQAIKTAQEAQAAFVEASKEVKVLETLRQKKKDEHTEYVLKEEEKQMDEVTIQRFSRLQN